MVSSRRSAATRGRKRAQAARSESSSSRDSSSLSPVKSLQSLNEEEGGDGDADGDVSMVGTEEVIAEDEEDAEEEDGDEEGEEGDGDEEDGDEEEDGDDEDEDGDDAEDGEDGEDGEDEDDGDDAEDADDAEEAEGASASVTYTYPAAAEDWNNVPERERDFKLARFMKCTTAKCDCEGLQPPVGAHITVVPRDQEESEEAGAPGSTEEGWWSDCGNCGHGWEGDEGHVLPKGLADGERLRRGRVVGRIEELLQDDGLLTTFPTPELESVTSLVKQLHSFQRPTGGKKPVSALPPAFDLSGDGDTGTPFSSVGADTPAGSDEERPLKRSRPAEEEGEDEDEAGGRHGKKPGKTGGKGTKPRTVVRGARGLVPMETDAAGNQHVAGRLPDSAVNGEGGAEEDEEEDVPLAKVPQLDEGERRRREVIKEKAREREDEVLRGLAKGTNVEDGAEGTREHQADVDVEIWEGVELPKLPPRPAMVEQLKKEIMLMVVGSRNPTPVSTILLIGLKNLFQRQLPKMPREYITRLVLDKNHISLAIVKRGWKVVGGICYRPFESRGFAEIVFCAVDSSEQIKGYGGHLMNALKDHVREAHPSINHFLTYADNYAVGYFKKQGFKKEISLEREKWVGYIKDYEGGTIMQCTMLPKVRYTEVHQMLADQKAAVLAKIRTISRSHIVHPGLQVFKGRKPGQEIKLSKEDVPGLAESGWNPDLDEIIRQPKRNPDHVLLQHVLNDMQNENSAWPFVKPVDRSVVVDYDSVVSNPMDLSMMEYKLENNHYSGVDDFVSDAHLMFNNCRLYNGEKSTYTVQANRLEKALDRILKNRRAAALGGE